MASKVAQRVISTPGSQTKQKTEVAPCPSPHPHVNVQGAGKCSLGVCPGNTQQHGFRELPATPATVWSILSVSFLQERAERKVAKGPGKARERRRFWQLGAALGGSHT